MARDLLQDIAATLNDVISIGQERAAIGAALNALGDAYGMTKYLSDFATYGEDATVRELDTRRFPLEEAYNAISADDSEPVNKEEWAVTHNLILAAYVSYYGVLGGVKGMPKPKDVLEILVDSIKNAPRVFYNTVKETLTEVLEDTVNLATKPITNAIWTFFKNTWPILLLGVVVLIVLSRYGKISMPNVKVL
jgi:hypothetical protein